MPIDGSDPEKSLAEGATSVAVAATKPMQAYYRSLQGARVKHLRSTSASVSDLPEAFKRRSTTGRGMSRFNESGRQREIAQDGAGPFEGLIPR